MIRTFSSALLGVFIAIPLLSISQTSEGSKYYRYFTVDAPANFSTSKDAIPIDARIEPFESVAFCENSELWLIKISASDPHRIDDIRQMLQVKLIAIDPKWKDSTIVMLPISEIQSFCL